jgi:hypothetical protein
MTATVIVAVTSVTVEPIALHRTPVGALREA